MRHPQHDEIATVVRGWYRTSYPEMGYRVERRRYGWYARNAAGAGMSRIEVGDISADDVPDLLANARDYFGAVYVTLHVDDRRLDAELGPALAAAGCQREQATVYLAHVGKLSDAPTTPAVDIVMCDEALLEEHAIAKLKGFADSEEEPSRAEVSDEVAVRLAELAGTGRFSIARLGGEAAATIGWYTGGDAFIFDLATRVPYRHHGIATGLIRYVIESEYADGARSVIINADEGGQPAQLYRRLGFTDEVCWRQQYRLPAQS
jgi:GNAT superfamily N-acetyltransferase